MRLHLTCPDSGKIEITLPDERKPSQIISMSSVQCIYELEKHPDYYNLTLSTECQVTIGCQRCMEPFDLLYRNQTQIGLCEEESVAERIMDIVEPVVITNDVIPFESIVADELHLYLPLFHQDLTQCQYLGC